MIRKHINTKFTIQKGTIVIEHINHATLKKKTKKNKTEKQNWRWTNVLLVYFNLFGAWKSLSLFRRQFVFYVFVFVFIDFVQMWELRLCQFCSQFMTQFRINTSVHLRILWGYSLSNGPLFWNLHSHTKLSFFYVHNHNAWENEMIINRVRETKLSMLLKSLKQWFFSLFISVSFYKQLFFCCCFFYSLQRIACIVSLCRFDLTEQLSLDLLFVGLCLCSRALMFYCEKIVS